MPVAKRKRVEDPNSTAGISEEVDISSALTSKRQKVEVADDEELADFIQSSIAIRSVKEGTQILKKTKGKSKVARGEVGGGSFQSMGVFQNFWQSHLPLIENY